LLYGFSAGLLFPPNFPAYLDENLFRLGDEFSFESLRFLIVPTPHI